MNPFKIARRAVLGAALAACTAFAQGADSFPNKPIHIIVPFGAGTTTDQAARFIGQHLSEKTGQPVVVENKAGANGFIALQYLLLQPADGYTFTIGTNTTHAANAALFKKVPYDPVADFVPLSGVIIGGSVLAIAPSTAANNVQELLTLARKNPGRMSFGGGNSAARVSGELLKELGGVDIIHVPYKTLPAAINDVMGGQIDMVFGDAPAIIPQVRAGKMKALGVTTAARMPGFEEIPTMQEQGLRGFELNGWLAAFAPRGTPPDVANKLSKMIADIMRGADAEKFFGQNAWKPMPGTGAELAAFQRAELQKWQRMVKSAGIEPE
jgi:tripartite-type tricarboxylate transporter receptor subunit TctC